MITTAWAKLLATHDEASFDEFIARNEDRLNLGLLHSFWTPAALPIGKRNRLPHH